MVSKLPPDAFYLIMPYILIECVIIMLVAVVLRYVAVAWWRPAFNVHRDNWILLLPNDFVLVFTIA